jgi:NAD(P)-dependent dehydrogenase (short-subunit alcohol dehydrogenase family)
MSTYIDDLFTLKDRRAVVIGGTGVLGGRIAQALALAGATVVVAGRNIDKGNQRVEAIRRTGGAASFLGVDVTNRDSILELADSAEWEIGPIDILINSAGVNSAEPYFDISSAGWSGVMTTNLASVHWACQAFARGMAERGKGCIINVASVAADRPLSRVFAYSASKAAVVNYSQNLARELASKNVRVNCLSPGFFPAEQNREILDAERQSAVLGHTPMGRFGEPSDLDGAVLLLASDRAGKFITGANLFVDGGFTAMKI